MNNVCNDVKQCLCIDVKNVCVLMLNNVCNDVKQCMQ